MQTARRARLAGAILPPPRCAEQALLPPAPCLSAPLQQLPLEPLKSLDVFGVCVYNHCSQTSSYIINMCVPALAQVAGSGTSSRQSAGRHPERQAQKSAAAPQVGRVSRP